MNQGPLAGVSILEFSGIGPGPFVGMLLSDLGADVLRIDRKGNDRGTKVQVTRRGRKSVALDLKKPEAIETCLRLMERADATFEGFRPGVMERLGLGPDAALARNPGLVYGRMTGWGQFGPLAQAAGHDINYIAVTGALHAIGLPDKPVPPLNLVGDFGGGAMYLLVGILAALLHARRTGEGQVVDAAMSDGTASLLAMFYGHMAAGAWSDDRAANQLDGGAPYYDTYRCKDGRWMAVGAIEPQFFTLLLEKLGIADFPREGQLDRSMWPNLRARIEAAFLTRTQREWIAEMEGSDACAAGVIGLEDAPNHPHNVARRAFVTIDGVLQPAPAPRFSATPGRIQETDPAIGAHNISGLMEWGLTRAEVAALEKSAAL
ncbi:carnitine dehydratase [Sphingopyxis lindanitolerans]|uniref:Carnitine dehydratase n=1 Tax=Sphingopyxis lindanitolerans TaxID=2054227 RepID=A0A2S8B3M0_9SPHN|nr:CaiB/BaiF CoA-transferase family protein [Sphingopyxis lindanitolerans]PQM26992.1 carnitine dehydratase [Sphingopyxis lindanitolerans]